MTYVEFFDKVASENVSACLTYAPERVIYIGDDSDLMKKHIENYSKMFSNRGVEIEFLYKSVSKSNLERAVCVLQEIVDTYDDCVFDITGGEEILTLALGIIYERNTDKNIQIHRFNLRNNAIYDCDKDGTTIFKDMPALTVQENVRIYGGDVLFGDVTEDNTYLWDLTPSFTEDVEAMWRICKKHVRTWNTQIGVFDAMEEVGTVSQDGLTTTAKIFPLQAYLKKNRASYKMIKGIVAPLLEERLITFIEYDDNSVTVTYKNPQVKRCLTKAGQALEMKMYLIFCGLKDGQGKPIYNDIINGVLIDWDGKFHDEETEGIYDTENEIDIFLMHDMVPVFISCKNGIVSADELYKLSTVARRFGGDYAKKVLIATALSSSGDKAEYIRQRAKDMNIKLIEDVQNLSDEAIAKKFKTLWSN